LPHRAQARAHYAAAAAAGPPPADPSRRRRNNNNNGIGGAGGLAYLHGRGVWNWTRDDFASGLHDGAGLAVGQLQGGSGEAPSDPPLVVAVGFQITTNKKKKETRRVSRRTSRSQYRVRYGQPLGNDVFFVDLYVLLCVISATTPRHLLGWRRTSMAKE
jgi:hypothetical protein